MTPKEKAEYLVDKYLNEMPKYLQGNLGRKTSKQCALICVEQVINTYDLEGYEEEDSKMEYWQQVKQEVSLL